MHTSLDMLNGTADVFSSVLPKKRENYGCCRDDYKIKKIPPKSGTNRTHEAKNRHCFKVTAVYLITRGQLIFTCYRIYMTELMFQL